MPPASRPNSTARRIGLVVLVLVLCVDAFLAGRWSATPEEPKAPQPLPTDLPTQVWLLPVEGVPQTEADDLAQWLSNDLKLRVRASLLTGMPACNRNAQGQVLAGSLAKALATPISRLREAGENPMIIVLLADDMNSEDGKLRYTFAVGFDGQRLALVSTARTKESFFGLRNRPELTRVRNFKILKKQIGIGYLGMKRSTSMSSVLYSPIMGLEDLDAIGNHF